MMFQVSGVAVDHVDLTVRLAVSLDDLRSVLREIAAEPLFGPLWPHDEPVPRTPATPHTRAKTVEGCVSAMRYRARQHCPGGLLADFERDLREVDVALRGALAQPYTARCAVGTLLASVEQFGKRWQPYCDPPPSPPPRFRCDETDRSVWLDGQCIASNLERPEFAFVSALAAAEPEPISFRTMQAHVRCLQSANQTRLLEKLPPELRKVIESSNAGYALKLPPKLSTTVEAA